MKKEMQLLKKKVVKIFLEKLDTLKRARACIHYQQVKAIFKLMRYHKDTLYWGGKREASKVMDTPISTIDKLLKLFPEGVR